MPNNLGTDTVNAGCALSGDYYNIPRRGAFKKLSIKHKRLSGRAFAALVNAHVAAKTRLLEARLGKRAKCVIKK